MPTVSGRRYGRVVLRWTLYILAALALAFVGFVLYRVPVVAQKERSAQTVEYIHAQKLTLADVDGKHLPPPPDPTLVDTTVEGIDANQNGIRDDVELAIFAKYPNDLKLRAALLQYAMTEQMYLTSVFDTETWKAVAEENSRAFSCLLTVNREDSLRLSDEVGSLVSNITVREVQKERAFGHITSYGSAPGQPCDLDV